jgi:hypothetical protein
MFGSRCSNNRRSGQHPGGRWPANVMHDGSDDVLKAFAVFGDRQGDSISRFFYCAKANKQERGGSTHPCIKPLKLMQYLVRLVTPRGGIVLEPFAGSGTTGLAACMNGFSTILIERDAEYIEDIKRRLARWIPDTDHRIESRSFDQQDIAQATVPVPQGTREILNGAVIRVEPLRASGPAPGSAAPAPVKMPRSVKKSAPPAISKPIPTTLITNRNVVLSWCDRTTTMVQPWAEAGFECYCVDKQHPEGQHREGNIIRIGADIKTWQPPPRRYCIVFAFPPCTNLAVSGAAWFRSKGMQGLTDDLELVKACRRICIWTEAPWMIENPVSTLSSYWKPDYIFDPREFGGWPGGENDGYTKKTCLWTGGGFRYPEKRPIPVNKPNYINHMPPSPQRSDLRSVTPAGFARSVFEANIEHLNRKAD